MHALRKIRQFSAAMLLAVGLAGCGMSGAETQTRAPMPAPTRTQTHAPTRVPTRVQTQAPTQPATPAPTQSPTQAPVQTQAPRDVQDPEPEILQVSTAEAATMLERERSYMLVDARPEADFLAGHIPGSINVPYESVGDEPPEALPDKDQRIFIYCGGGGLSYQLAVKLRDMGYTNLVKFGGMKEWTGAVETGSGPTLSDAIY